jgi:hypothetical protein
MKKLVVLIIAIISFGTLNAQSEQATDVEKGIHKLNFIPLAYSYEARIAQAQTFMVQPSFGFNWISSSAAYPTMQLTSFYRYYYNFDKRNAKGKRTIKNSANYFGAMMSFSFWDATWSGNVSNEDYIPYWAAGPVWGIQRNYRSHFSLGLTLGPMLSVGNKGFRADGYFELTLGFWLGK